MQLIAKDESNSNIVQLLLMFMLLRLDNTRKMRMKCAKMPELNSIHWVSLEIPCHSNGSRCISGKSPQNNWKPNTAGILEIGEVVHAPYYSVHAYRERQRFFVRPFIFAWQVRRANVVLVLLLF